MRRFLAPLLLVLVGAPSASAWVPATELAASLTPSTGIDIDDLGRIVVEGPAQIDGGPDAEILLPPHPGVGTLVLPCEPDRVACGVVHEARGVTHSGRIFGRSAGFFSPFASTPTTWDSTGTITTSLPNLPAGFPFGDVRAGNASDRFVGWRPSIGFGGPFSAPVFWDGPTATPILLSGLPSTDPEEGPFPSAVSDLGSIVGTTSGAGRRAAVWHPPAFALEFLGELPGGTRSRANDLNDAGLVVGSADDGTQDVALVWRASGSSYDRVLLPAPTGFDHCADAVAIDANDRIVGNCVDGDGRSLGVVWVPDGSSWRVIHVLHPLASDHESAVAALNVAGQAVGRSGVPARAVLWEIDAPAHVPALPWAAVLGLSVALLGLSRVLRH